MIMKNQLWYSDDKKLEPMSQGSSDSYRITGIGLLECKRFGLFPDRIVAPLEDDSVDMREKYHALEQMKMHIDDSHGSLAALAPHVDPVLEFLGKLMRDSDAKINAAALEVVMSLVHNLPQKVILANMHSFCVILIQRMGDMSIFCRKAVVETVVKMMKVCRPPVVLQMLCNLGLVHRNAKIRQETLNFVIITLLIFPSSDIDLLKLLDSTCDQLLDDCRPVRQAALECTAVLAHVLGPAKQQDVMLAVSKIELQSGGSGVTEAVIARLSNRQLPKQNADGLVEYATYANSSNGSATYTADVNWILCAPSKDRCLSAKSSAADKLSLCNSPVPPSAVMGRTASPSVPESPRFGLSARLRRSARKFPWDTVAQAARQNEMAPESVSPEATTAKVAKVLSPVSPHSNSQKLVLRNEVEQLPLDTNGVQSPVDNLPPSGSTSARRLCKSASLRRLDRMFAQLDTGDVSGGGVGDIDETSYTNGTGPRRDRASADANGDEKISSPAAFSPAKRDKPPGGKKRLDNQVRTAAAGQHKTTTGNKTADEAFSAWIVDINDDDINDVVLQPTRNESASKQRQRKRTAENKNAAKRKLSKGSIDPYQGSTTNDGELSTASAAGQVFLDPVAPMVNRVVPIPGIPNSSSAAAFAGVGGGFQDHDEKVIVTEYTRRQRATNEKLQSPSDGDAGVAGWWEHDGRVPAEKPPGSQSDNRSNLPRPVLKTNYQSPAAAAAEVRTRNRSVERPPSLEPIVNTLFQRKQSLPTPDVDDFAGHQLGDFRGANVGVFSSPLPSPYERGTRSLPRLQHRKALDPEMQLDKQRMQSSAKARLTNDVESMLEMPDIGNALTRKPPHQALGSLKKPRQKSAPPLTQISCWDGIDLTTSTPFNDPSAALNKTLQQLSSPDEEWERKCDGINDLRRLTFHHPKLLQAQLHTFVLAIVAEVKNLRSVVAVLALKGIADMYRCLQKDMVTELDATVPPMLLKTADTNNFIRDQAFESLVAVVENIPPLKVAAVFIAHGTSHRNATVRAAAAKLFVHLVELLGVEQALTGSSKELTERILVTMSQFLVDSSADVRFSGQKILYSLMSHSGFSQVLSRCVTAPDMQNIIQEKMEAMAKKGLSEPRRKSGLERKGSRRGENSAGPSKSAPTSAILGNGRKQRSSSATRGTDAAAQEAVAAMLVRLKASDFRERSNAILQLRDLATDSPYVVCSSITQIFDRFVPCLKDSNSKVNLLALGVLNDIVPCIATHFSNVATLTVNTVAANLASSNNDIYSAAVCVLDSLIEFADPVLLLPPFVNLIQSGNPRYKIDMVNRVTNLVPKLFVRKPNQAALSQLLPVLWSLLTVKDSVAAKSGGGTGLTSATANFASALYSQIGDELLELAAANPRLSGQARHTLAAMIARN